MTNPRTLLLTIAEDAVPLKIRYRTERTSTLFGPKRFFVSIRKKGLFHGFNVTDADGTTYLLIETVNAKTREESQ